MSMIKYFRLAGFFLLFFLGSSPAHAAFFLALVPFITAAVAFLTSGTLAANLTIAAIGIGASFLSTSLSSRGQQNAQRGEGPQKPKVNLPEYNSVGDSRDIYGTYVVSGLVFFQRTVADAGSTGTNIFVQGLILSEGICDGIESLIINGVECDIDVAGFGATAPWSTPGQTYLKVSFRSGTETQTIDPIILARFPDLEQEIRDDLNDQNLVFAQFGLSTIVLEMHYGDSQNNHAELWGAGGVADIKVRVRGKKLYNPINPVCIHSDVETYEFTNNATAVDLNYLLNNVPGIDLSQVNLDSFRDQVKIDDESVPILAGNEPRHTIDGPVKSSESYVDVLNAMIFTNGTQIYHSLGEYGIRGVRNEKPVGTLSNNQLVGDMTYTNHADSRSLLNSAKITFEPASKFNNDGEINFTVPDLVASDGETLNGDGALDMRFITRPGHAQRRAWEIIQETRYGATLSGEFDISALVVADENGYRLLVPGDVLNVDMADLGALDGQYVVDKFGLSKEFTVTPQMTETNPEIYLGYTTENEIEFKKDVA